MRSAYTKRKRNDGSGLIEERDGTDDVPKVIFAMDQTDTTQLSRGECSQPRRSIGETSQPSEEGHMFLAQDVFLSHSGKQKKFVRQLHTDLTNQGLSCFFDEDRESLPVAENFPPRIFEAAKTCKVAVLVLSKDFLEAKWPMLELSAFVKARDITLTNPNLKIVPLFFLISPDALKNTKENDEKWRQLDTSSERPLDISEWHEALKAIRPINGMPFSEGGNEVEYRAKIVEVIWRLHPSPPPRYHVRGMQGEERMCQEVTKLFNNVQPDKNGIRIAGLYGMAGQGKTTLGKAFCNFKLGEFEGKVCHLEFSRGDIFQRTKLALLYLTQCPQSYLQTLIGQNEAQVQMDRKVKAQRVLLVLDNITEESIDEVMYYLKANWKKESWILLSARSVDVLEKHFQIDKQSCMGVPRLRQDEAIRILMERSFAREAELEEKDRRFARKCAKRFLFKKTFHPLALKACGGYLSSKYGSNMSKWAAEMDEMVDRRGDSLNEVFALLDKSFHDMLPKYRTIFMLLTVYMLPNMSPDKVTEWLAIICNGGITLIENAVEDLRKKAFIEEFEPEIRIHDLYIEFAKSKANKMERWLWWKKEDDQCSKRVLIAEDKDGFELAKLQQWKYRRINPVYFRNLFVLQLVDVQNMSNLDLGPMDSLRSITLRDCKTLAAIDGMEKLVDLRWLQIIGLVNPLFKLPSFKELSNLTVLELVNCGIKEPPDLTGSDGLEDIYFFQLHDLVRFPSFSSLRELKKLRLCNCITVQDPPDIEGCHKLEVFHLLYNVNMKGLPKMDMYAQFEEFLVSWRTESLVRFYGFNAIVSSGGASSSTTRKRQVYFFPIEEHDPFLVLEPPNKKIESSLIAKQYEVFVNHYGPDVKKTLARQLYDSLQQAGIRAYLDSEETELRDSISSTIKNAISPAAVHIAIISPRYAESAWCLAELASVFQTTARIMPLFYHVQPSDLRYIKNEVADAFSKHEEKGSYQNDDIQQWKECLLKVSWIQGYQLNGQNDDLNKVCKDIVKEREKRKNIKAMLKMRFNYLDEEDKQIFTDIACFFKYMEGFRVDSRTCTSDPRREVLS